MVDRLTPKQRSDLMSRVRGRDTAIELSVRSALRRCGLQFQKNSRGLPGTPDIVFPVQKVAVFIDGDFWHGYRYPVWRDKLQPFWQIKIQTNRLRDRRNFAKLRRMGWRVIRLWQHDVERDLTGCLARVKRALHRDRRDMAG